ncbi:MAG TPA: glycosyltransferase [Candidatus Eisenbacteria bacterium]|nr:glycosyltransferase [Candidatus Eisenbacteria bacterium]
MTDLDLSVVVPCYDEAPHLAASTARLVEVLDQTRLAYEILFVDDCSRDDTRRVIQEICRTTPRCRFVFHERNRGRGGAFKTGYAATTGRVTGFLDIDLEVDAIYVPALVTLVARHGVDVATGFRHYLLRQTGGVHRHVLSMVYRGLLKVLLDCGVRDTETGCKFFNRATATDVVLGSECDGWFWDTEVMARAALANLRIVEMPVLFLRRMDKRSTVRLLPDTWQYLVELSKFRPKVGLSLANKSPIYWTCIGYDALMRMLYGRQYLATYRAVADRIRPGASVVDVCCGTGRLYRDALKDRGGSYLGLDFNGHFVMGARKRGVPVRSFNVLADPIPPADYVVMCSSFYHVRSQADAVLGRMRAAAREAVILSEPVHNLSTAVPGVIGRLVAAATNPGVGTEHMERYDLETFRAFAERHGASAFVHAPGDRNAIAIFPGAGG